MFNFIELTRSKLRKRLLCYFFTHPEASLYLREIAAIIKTDPGNLSKDLSRLVKEGIFNATEKGRQKYFSLNRNYPLFSELKSIIFKTVGIEGALREAIKEVRGINYAFIYGSYAQGKQNAFSDIDLLLVVDENRFDSDMLEEKAHELGRTLSREINYSYYPESEWSRKIRGNDSFIRGVLRQKKIMLIGNKNELQRLSKRG